MIRIAPEAHRSSTGDNATITVELDDDGGHTVRLVLEAEAGETFDDRDVDRYLTAPEARALAAMLVHFAEQAER